MAEGFGGPAPRSQPQCSHDGAYVVKQARTAYKRPPPTCKHLAGMTKLGQDANVVKLARVDPPSAGQD